MRESKSRALPTWLRPKMVERTGFEPVKSETTDLQSAPFGQLGYLSTIYYFIGAGDGTRTRNLLITSQLLCQLSYAGIFVSDNTYTNIFFFTSQPILLKLIVSTHCREKIISPILKGRPLEITFIPRCYGVVDNEPPPT